MNTRNMIRMGLQLMWHNNSFNNYARKKDLKYQKDKLKLYFIILK